IQYTSGSTSRPKGVVLTHLNLLENARGMQLHGGFDSNTIGFSWLPPYHDMGLISGLILPMCVGYPSILSPSKTFLRRPVSWLESISQFKVTMTGAPNFAFDFCVDKISDAEISGLSLSSLQAVFNGAESIREQTLKRFSERFKCVGFSSDVFSPVYGLAEATLMVSGIPAATAYHVRSFDNALLEKGVAQSSQNAASQRNLVSCGTALPNVNISIRVPGSDRQLGEGLIGEICVEGPSISPGYLNTQRDLADHNSVTVGDSALRTGDLGFLHEGELFVSGRLKHLIISRGRNIFPQDIEWSAGAAHTAINQNRVCAFAIDGDQQEQLVIICEIYRADVRDLPSHQVIQLVIEAVTAENRITPEIILLVKPGQIPLTTSGKVRRGECAQRFLGNTLQPIYQYVRPTNGAWRDGGTGSFDLQESSFWSEQTGGRGKTPSAEDSLASVERYLRTIVADLLGISPQAVSSNKPLAEIGIDSLLALDLAYRINSDSGAAIDPVLQDGVTLATLSKRVIAALQDNAAIQQAISEADTDSAGQVIPLSPIFLDEMASGERIDRYNISVFLRPPASLKSESLEALIETTLARHAVFYFRLNKSETAWNYDPKKSMTLMSFEIVELEDSTPNSVEEVKTQVDAHCTGAFDLKKGPLVRAVCIQDTVGHIKSVVISFSHSVVDAFSLWRLRKELEQAWRSLSGPHSIPMPPSIDEKSLLSSYQVQHYAQSAEVLGQISFWMSEKAKLFMTQGTPIRAADNDRNPDSLFFARERVSPEPSEALAAAFIGAGQRHDFFLTALVRAWCALTDHAMCSVSLESHGRKRASSLSLFTDAVGWVTVRFPLTLENNCRENIKSHYQQVEREVDRLPNEGHDFGALRWLCDQDEIKAQFHNFPIPPVRYVYRGRMDDRFRRSDEFKVIDVRVSRASRLGGAPSRIPEFSVSVREQAKTFVIDVEYLDGQDQTNLLVSPQRLAQRMVEEALSGVSR
ncbi:MAG: AMP-binding protein, partial [Proteobacteria bacterium]|nr:AMP-binding protein [Pseudomonadota bacterium]